MPARLKLQRVIGSTQPMTDLCETSVSLDKPCPFVAASPPFVSVDDIDFECSSTD